MAWAEHVHFYVDRNTYGGLLAERLLAAIVRDGGLYSGLVFTLGTAGHPTVEFWERIDDLERQGFTPISGSKARALCGALPCFLDHLEQAAAQQSAGPAGDNKDNTRSP